MTPTAVTPAARRGRPATSAAARREAPAGRTPSSRSDAPARSARSEAPARSARSAVAAPPRPSSLRSGKTTRAPRASRAAAAAAPARSAPARSAPPARSKPSRPRTPSASPKRSPQRASSARTAAPRSVRRSAAPRSPRRVSGPAGGRMALATAGAGAGGSVALPLPARPSLPSIRLPRPRLPHVELPSPGALLRRAGAFVASLPESSLLDRVIRGRIWIPLLGVLLVGIVGMQVANLKLSAGLGSAIEQTTTLQSRNDALRAAVTGLSSEQRIELIAGQHGMVMAPPTSVKFLRPGGPADVRRAIAGIHAPGSSYFVGPVGTSSAAAAAASPGSSTAPVGG
jgi:hypothetical protein